MRSQVLLQRAMDYASEPCKSSVEKLSDVWRTQMNVKLSKKHNIFTCFFQHLQTVQKSQTPPSEKPLSWLLVCLVSLPKQ